MTKMQTMFAAAALATLTAGAAQAQMVVNGGFETGDFSGWSETAAIGSVYGVDSAGPRNGDYSAYFGASTPDAAIWQTLATITGVPYRISFNFDRSAATTAGSFVASLGGVTFFSDPGFTQAFVPISVDVVAASDNAVLMFSANNASDFYTLDNVAVVAVPEPTAAALMLLGMAGLAWRRRRS